MPKTITGTVVSAKPDKTIIISTERRVVHPIYRKAYRVTRRIAAHDPGNDHKEGDTVTIVESRPISKRKRYTVVAAEEKKK